MKRSSDNFHYVTDHVDDRATLRHARSQDDREIDDFASFSERELPDFHTSIERDFSSGYNYKKDVTSLRDEDIMSSTYERRESDYSAREYRDRYTQDSPFSAETVSDRSGSYNENYHNVRDEVLTSSMYHDMDSNRHIDSTSCYSDEDSDTLDCSDSESKQMTNQHYTSPSPSISYHRHSDSEANVRRIDYTDTNDHIEGRSGTDCFHDESKQTGDYEHRPGRYKSDQDCGYVDNKQRGIDESAGMTVYDDGRSVTYEGGQRRDHDEKNDERYTMHGVKAVSKRDTADDVGFQSSIESDQIDRSEMRYNDEDKQNKIPYGSSSPHIHGDDIDSVSRYGTGRFIDNNMSTQDRIDNYDAPYSDRTRYQRTGSDRVDSEMKRNMDDYHDTHYSRGTGYCVSGHGTGNDPNKQTDDMAHAPYSGGTGTGSVGSGQRRDQYSDRDTFPPGECVRATGRLPCTDLEQADLNAGDMIGTKETSECSRLAVHDRGGLDTRQRGDSESHHSGSSKRHEGRESLSDRARERMSYSDVKERCGSREKVTEDDRESARVYDTQTSRGFSVSDTAGFIDNQSALDNRELIDSNTQYRGMDTRNSANKRKQDIPEVYRDSRSDHGDTSVRENINVKAYEHDSSSIAHNRNSVESARSERIGVSNRPPHIDERQSMKYVDSKFSNNRGSEVDNRSSLHLSEMRCSESSVNTADSRVSGNLRSTKKTTSGLNDNKSSSVSANSELILDNRQSIPTSGLLTQDALFIEEETHDKRTSVSTNRNLNVRTGPLSDNMETSDSSKSSLLSPDMRTSTTGDQLSDRSLESMEFSSGTVESSPEKPYPADSLRNPPEQTVTRHAKDVNQKGGSRLAPERDQHVGGSVNRSRSERDVRQSDGRYISGLNTNEGKLSKDGLYKSCDGLDSGYVQPAFTPLAKQKEERTWSSSTFSIHGEIVEEGSGQLKRPKPRMVASHTHPLNRQMSLDFDDDDEFPDSRGNIGQFKAQSEMVVYPGSPGKEPRDSVFRRPRHENIGHFKAQSEMIVYPQDQRGTDFSEQPRHDNISKCQSDMNVFQGQSGRYNDGTDSRHDTISQYKCQSEMNMYPSSQLPMPEKLVQNKCQSETVVYPSGDSAKDEDLDLEVEFHTRSRYSSGSSTASPLGITLKKKNFSLPNLLQQQYIDSGISSDTGSPMVPDSDFDWTQRVRKSSGSYRDSGRRKKQTDMRGSQPALTSESIRDNDTFGTYDNCEPSDRLSPRSTEDLSYVPQYAQDVSPASPFDTRLSDGVDNTQGQISHPRSDQIVSEHCSNVLAQKRKKLVRVDSLPVSSHKSRASMLRYGFAQRKTKSYDSEPLYLPRTPTEGYLVERRASDLSIKETIAWEENIESAPSSFVPYQRPETEICENREHELSKGEDLGGREKQFTNVGHVKENKGNEVGDIQNLGDVQSDEKSEDIPNRCVDAGREQVQYSDGKVRSADRMHVDEDRTGYSDNGHHLLKHSEDKHDRGEDVAGRNGSGSLSDKHDRGEDVTGRNGSGSLSDKHREETDFSEKGETWNRSDMSETIDENRDYTDRKNIINDHQRKVNDNIRDIRETRDDKLENKDLIDEQESWVNNDRIEIRNDRYRRETMDDRNRREIGVERDRRETGVERDRRETGVDRNRRETGVDREVRDERDRRETGVDRDRRETGVDRDRRETGVDREIRDDRDRRETGVDREIRDDRDRREIGVDRDRRETGVERDRRETGVERDRRETGVERDGRETGVDREIRDDRDRRENKNGKFRRETRNERERIETRDTRDRGKTRNDVDGREIKDDRDRKETREDRDRRETRDVRHRRETGADRNGREIKDDRDRKETRGDRDRRENRDGRDTRENIDDNEKRKSKDGWERNETKETKDRREFKDDRIRRETGNERDRIETRDDRDKGQTRNHREIKDDRDGKESREDEKLDDSSKHYDRGGERNRKEISDIYGTKSGLERGKEDKRNERGGFQDRNVSEKLTDRGGSESDIDVRRDRAMTHRSDEDIVRKYSDVVDRLQEKGETDKDHVHRDNDDNYNRERDDVRTRNERSGMSGKLDASVRVQCRGDMRTRDKRIEEHTKPQLHREPDSGFNVRQELIKPPQSYQQHMKSAGDRFDNENAIHGAAELDNLTERQIESRSIDQFAHRNSKYAGENSQTQKLSDRHSRTEPKAGTADRGQKLIERQNIDHNVYRNLNPGDNSKRHTRISEMEGNCGSAVAEQRTGVRVEAGRPGDRNKPQRTSNPNRTKMTKENRMIDSNDRGPQLSQKDKVEFHRTGESTTRHENRCVSKDVASQGRRQDVAPRQTQTQQDVTQVTEGRNVRRESEAKSVKIQSNNSKVVPMDYFEQNEDEEVFDNDNLDKRYGGQTRYDTRQGQGHRNQYGGDVHVNGNVSHVHGRGDYRNENQSDYNHNYHADYRNRNDNRNDGRNSDKQVARYLVRADIHADNSPVPPPRGHAKRSGQISPLQGHSRYKQKPKYPLSRIQYDSSVSSKDYSEGSDSLYPMREHCGIHGAYDATMLTSPEYLQSSGPIRAPLARQEQNVVARKPRRTTDGPVSLSDSVEMNSQDGGGHSESKTSSTNQTHPSSASHAQSSHASTNHSQSSTANDSGAQAQTQVNGTEHRSNLKNLPIEEVLEKCRGIVGELGKLEEYHRGEGMRLQKMLGDFYWDYSSQRQQIGDTIAEAGYAELTIKMLKSLNTIGIFKNDDVWFPAYYTYNTTWNYSDTSDVLAKNLAEADAVRLLTLNCSHKPYLTNIHSKNVFYVIKASMSILHNIARNPNVKAFFKENKTAEVVMPFINMNDDMLRVLAMLTLAYIVEEEDNSKLIDETGTIKNVVMWIGKALDNAKRRFKGFTPQELTQGLDKLAVNDGNKPKIIEEGSIPLFMKMLQSDNDKEQSTTARCVWTLAFDKDVRKLLLETENLISTLDKLAESQVKDVKKNAQGALWVLNGKGDAPADRPRSAPRGKNHIFISYSWNEQEKVLEIRDRLRSEGYVVWVDVDHMGGSTLQAMAEAVENAAVVLVCMSEKYKQSPNCRTEAEYTFQLRKDYIPLMMQKRYRPDGWLGMILGAKLFFDFSGKYPFEKSASGLLKELRGRGKRSNVLQGQTVDESDHLQATESNQLVQAGNPHRNMHPNTEIALAQGNHPQTHLMSRDDVQRWLIASQLDGSIASFSQFDGRLLWQLREMKHEAPEYFYQCLERKLNMNLIDVLRLASALDTLH